jgi:hypothetical protein
MNDIYFPSEDSGVVAFFDINDYDTYIMVTGNGGNSWHTVLSNGDLALGYRSVVALDNETIVAAGAYAAAITSDGGNSWVEYPFPFVNLGPFPNDMVFVSATEGWIAGRFILKTNDGGFTWTVEDSTIDNYGVELNTLKFPSADTGYAAGNYGLILKYVNTSTVTNVEIITSPNLLVYPNPASSFINIKHPYQEVELNISNSMGEIILKREVMKEESFVDVSSFPPGIYLIKLVSMNEVAIHKFVKQ